ncbi:hypothetical protein BU24DRAFT_420028 [Aaosphaeria arxii CBS 175.79]|uniref:Genetic interactor of prohibitins 3, mitochondrial n=1 Tax=Aaosphaeria arxii CBS 175.79 TaxID=1450172 RepID=A0A6A5XVL7_9PLEO|nr:uncharacterized protein BU24DRAFT_420028 [Aaosphaeria arxii CBS 175.79]KAF2016986.1 hypothetical protein BU24DRAFT_420028 [Aaosphaeria arxii CBS 175.79]
MRAVLRQARHHLPSESLAAHHAYNNASVPAFLCPALLRGTTTTTTLGHPTSLRKRVTPSKSFSTFRSNREQQQIAVSTEQHHIQPDVRPPASEETASSPTQLLPRACPGCGAPSQVFDKSEAGYYNIDRKQVKTYLNYDPAQKKEEEVETDIYTNRLKEIDPALLEELGLDQETLDAPKHIEDAAPETPYCDRCHNLLHHNIANPIHHPSVDAIKETIAESPHRRNHIYHVVDAADFPLSLVPNLQSALRLPKLRTQNRRARHKGWVGANRIAEVSFIVTRADLLAPMKEQVDKLLPYVQNVMRTALGRVNKTARLGNVYLVSSKRGWWTKKVKEDIWERGGAGWMVGKVNVGKSNLFEVVFPKGRGADYEDLRKIRAAAEREERLQNAKTMEESSKLQDEFQDEDKQLARRKESVLEPATDPEHFPEEDEEDFDSDSLLPPRQPYNPFPVLPIASALPGTTASPIRIPFGRNRGELIDLPGLARTTPELTTFVDPSHHDDLVMKHRVTAQRHVLKPGKSLLLGGGLIRLTPSPNSSDLTFLVHPFVPLTPHVTSTEKASTLQSQTRPSGVPSILLPNVGPQMSSAGIFPLQWDVTKQLGGALTSPMAGKMKPANLPFRIYSTDILIEGVGWVEVSCQVRRGHGWKPVGMAKKDPNHARVAKLAAQEELRRIKDEKFGAKEVEGDAFDRAGLGAPSSPSSSLARSSRSSRERFEEVEEEDEWFPEIEVFSPLGKYVGARMPMCGSVLGGPKPVSSRERSARPRRSMVAVKRQRKPMVRSTSE